LRKLQTSKLILFIAMLFVGACGGSGSGDGSGAGSSIAAGGTTVSGSIQDATGSQTGMSDQIMVLYNRDTGLSYVSVIDATGIYTFYGVDTSAVYTLVLLSSTYKYSATLSVPGAVANTVQQYFTLSGATVPRIKHNGLVLNFLEFVGISLANDVAADSDGDGTPDGSNYFAGISLQASLAPPGLNLMGNGSTVDTDLDGKPNHQDSDLDGDGVPNFIDDDDDGDGTLDVFDNDHNGDVINDSIQELGDVYFSVGVAWVSAQISLEPSSDGTANNIYITFNAKLRGDISPVYVSVRGPDSILKKGVIEAVTTTEAAALTAETTEWDGKLIDDGASEDGAKGDLIYGKKVKLESFPYGHQLIFVQIAYGDSTSPYFVEFPYTFGNLQPDKDISLSVPLVTTSETFSLAGDSPFSTVTDYLWYINIYNSDDKKIHTAGPTAGKTSSTTIPSDKFADGTYAIAIVQSQDRVDGKPTYIIKSPKVTLTK
jgi:hypothetical protein